MATKKMIAKPKPKSTSRSAPKRKPASSKKKVPAAGIVSTSELLGDPKNPRSISDAAAAGLSVSLDQFGDLSGIVFNETTQQLVCGHQRVTQIRERWGELPIVGDVIRSPAGHEFRVRRVAWPLAKQRAANIAANSQRIAGEFNDGLDLMLAGIKSESPELFDSLLFAELQHAVATPPDEFPAVDENLPTEHTCPKCHYQWAAHGH